MKNKFIMILIILSTTLLCSGCNYKNEKIAVDDILGTWTTEDAYRGIITIEFKEDGKIIYKDELNDNSFEYGYQLNYGVNVDTYIEIDCPINIEGYYCHFADFQKIDIVNDKLYFLGGSFHPGFNKKN